MDRLLPALDGLPPAYLVGGAVRDLLLQGRSIDIDIAVESDARVVAAELAARLDGRCIRHERFGTATVHLDDFHVDLVTTRRETYREPGEPSPPGWDEYPGARGCTPENCAFRDHAADLATLGASVYGLSAQPLEEQISFAEREHMPYPLLNDAALRLASGLGLPTFEAGGMTLYKRLTLIARRGRIEHVFYPVFPPDTHAGDVVSWLRAAA